MSYINALNLKSTMNFIFDSKLLKDYVGETSYNRRNESAARLLLRGREGSDVCWIFNAEEASPREEGGKGPFTNDVSREGEVA